MAIPLPAGLCDTIVCFAAFPHFADQPKALREMTRVAKRGTPLIIAHLMSREELLEHHGNHSPVAGDTIPVAADMKHMFQSLKNAIIGKIVACSHHLFPCKPSCDMPS